MKASQKERLEVGREVMKALRHRDFRNSLSRTNADGEHPIIVALPDDRMSQIFEQVRGLGDVAYIGIRGLDGDIEFISMAPACDESTASTAEVADECPIHGDTSVGMLVTYLRAHRGPLRCREVEPGVTMELVADSGPLPTASG